MAQPAVVARPLSSRPSSDRDEPSRRRALHLAERDTGVVRGLLDAGELHRAAALAAEPTVEGGASAGIDRGWPVAAPLAGLLPTGMLRRGSVVPVLGSTSLLWAMISVASRAGAWGRGSRHACGRSPRRHRNPGRPHRRAAELAVRLAPYPQISPGQNLAVGVRMEALHFLAHPGTPWVCG